MNPYTIVDLAHWKRREHCMVFRNHIEPAFCVTWELDITRFCSKSGSSICRLPWRWCMPYLPVRIK